MTGKGMRPDKPRHPRLSISVDRDVGEEFSQQAGRTGKSLYAFANEWLGTVAKISAEGGTADRTLDEWEVLTVLRDEEVIPLPAAFVEDLVEGLCEADREKALKTFRTLGENLVNLLKVYAPDIGKLGELARGFARIAPLKRLEIDKVDANSIVLSAIGVGKKFEVTECAFEFVKAILDGYGFAVTSHEIGGGIIRVEAKRRTMLAEPSLVHIPA